MVDHNDLTRLKAAYQNWHDTKGEGERARNGWLDIFDDRMRIISMGDTTREVAFAKARTSKRDAVNYFAELLTDWQMIHWTPEIFVQDQDHIAMFGRCAWTHRRTQKPVECRIAHLWRFTDGKASELTEIFDSAQAVAAATP
jgi:uncharacterized protein